MAAFHFSLQQVLDYRGQLKEQAQVELARAQGELLREQRHAETLQTQLEEQEHILRTTALGDPGERWLRENFIRGVRSDLSTTLLRVRNLNIRTEEARRQVALRSKEQKILEKLKEKQAARHAFNEQMQEQRTYDETAALRFKAPTF